MFTSSSIFEDARQEARLAAWRAALLGQDSFSMAREAVLNFLRDEASRPEVPVGLLGIRPVRMPSGDVWVAGGDSLGRVLVSAEALARDLAERAVAELC